MKEQAYTTKDGEFVGIFGKTHLGNCAGASTQIMSDEVRLCCSDYSPEGKWQGVWMSAEEALDYHVAAAKALRKQIKARAKLTS